MGVISKYALGFSLSSSSFRSASALSSSPGSGGERNAFQSSLLSYEHSPEPPTPPRSAPWVLYCLPQPGWSHDAFPTEEATRQDLGVFTTVSQFSAVSTELYVNYITGGHHYMNKPTYTKSSPSSMSPVSFAVILSGVP